MPSRVVDDRLARKSITASLVAPVSGIETHSNLEKSSRIFATSSEVNDMLSTQRSVMPSSGLQPGVEGCGKTSKISYSTPSIVALGNSSNSSLAIPTVRSEQGGETKRASGIPACKLPSKSIFLRFTWSERSNPRTSDSWLWKKVKSFNPVKPLTRLSCTSVN